MKILIASLVVVAFALTSADALCAPGIAPNITLYSNYTLAWSPALNPNGCTISTYVINVIDIEQNGKYQYLVGGSTYSFGLSSVDMCKAYAFEVHALTNDSVLGPSEQYSATTSASKDINLSIASVASVMSSGDIRVSWNLSTPTVNRCISYYRVVYWDDSNSPKDVYVTGNTFILKGDVPCAKYNFQINAIIINPDIQGPISELVTKGHSQISNVPSLVSLNTTSTSATMVWKLEKYAQNLCNMSALRVITIGAPANISNIQIPITDNLSRPNVVVRLTDLFPDNVYLSSVSVINEAGASKNITVTFQTKHSYIFNRETDLVY